MKVSFYIRKNKINKEGLAPIMMDIKSNGLRIRKNIPGIKSEPHYWDIKKERIKPNKKSSSYNFHLEYNSIIDEIDSKMTELYRYSLLNSITITKDAIELKLKNENEFKITEHGFFETFDRFIEIGKLNKAERTIKGYVTVYRFLEEYQTHLNLNLHFDSIDIDFFDSFQDYAYKVKKTSNNYFAKITTIIKTFMRWSMDRDYHENSNFTKFKATEKDIEVIYLTFDELMTLYNYEFETEKLRKVRDVFVLGSTCGLRYSDLQALRPSNIRENSIVLNIIKTKTTDHSIPLNKYSKAIFAKYKDTIHYPIPIISPQKFNKYIKECCEICGIDSEITITRYIGSKRIDKTLPKFKLISSHNARKTFVTNSLVLGMSESVVKNITNHKKDSSFQKYVKIADEFKKNQMDDAWGNN